MLEIPEDHRERDRLFDAIDHAFRVGDFAALGKALGGSPRWFDETMPVAFGLGHPLEYAIYWSPLAFIEKLILAGSSVDYDDDAGFPALIAALSTSRADRLDILRLLIGHGADLARRGINDWTALHYAASTGNLAALRILLEAGADPTLRTRIDDLATPVEEAVRGGFAECAALLREAERRRERPA